MPNQTHSRRRVRVAARSNAEQGSLVAVVTRSDAGNWITPDAGAEFYIDKTASFPTIVFEIESDVAPPYQWSWDIRWNAKASGLSERSPRRRQLAVFSESGSFASQSKSWTANLDGKVLGGTLTVTVMAGVEKFQRTVSILGENPSEAEVIAFLGTIPDAGALEKVIRQESRFKNFLNADHEPIVSFDRGYGLTQTTNPPPSYEQIWNWKENVRGGVRIYKQKKGYAKEFLGRSGRNYTDDQLIRETVSRWNGGLYHQWNPQTQSWERRSEILCDPVVANIGWNIENQTNSGKTEAELHERDKATYRWGSRGQSAEHEWHYSGVCYAEHVVNP